MRTGSAHAQQGASQRTCKCIRGTTACADEPAVVNRHSNAARAVARPRGGTASARVCELQKCASALRMVPQTSMISIETDENSRYQNPNVSTLKKAFAPSISISIAWFVMISVFFVSIAVVPGPDGPSYNV